jgi:hypothetical protein
MIKLTLLIGILFSNQVFAKNIKNHNKFTPSEFEVIPLNSPVKESYAKFSLKLPNGFLINHIKIKLVNAHDLNRDLKKFEDVNVTNNNQVEVNVSKLPPGFYRLYVKVKEKTKQKEHEFKTQYHDFVRFIIDESLEVAMPDPKKNNSTLAGIDSDRDGIRDDVQRWINESYPDSLKKRLALKQSARDFQLDLLSFENKELSIQAAKQGLNSSNCIDYIFGLEEASKISKKFQALFLNTNERILAEMKGNQNFSGQSYRLPKENDFKNYCNFDVDSIQ